MCMYDKIKSPLIFYDNRTCTSIRMDLLNQLETVLKEMSGKLPYVNFDAESTESKFRPRCYLLEQGAIGLY